MTYGSLINMFYLEVGIRTVVLCTLCVNFKAISRNMQTWRHICVVSLQIKFLSHFVYLLFIIFFIIEPTFFKGFLFMVLDTICKGKQWKIPQLY